MKSGVTKPKLKDDAKLVSPDAKSEPFYGCMKGLATIPRDVSKPIDVHWKALK